MDYAAKTYFQFSSRTSVLATLRGVRQRRGRGRGRPCKAEVRYRCRVHPHVDSAERPSVAVGVMVSPTPQRPKDVGCRALVDWCTRLTHYHGSVQVTTVLYSLSRAQFITKPYEHLAAMSSEVRYGTYIQSLSRSGYIFAPSSAIHQSWLDPTLQTHGPVPLCRPSRSRPLRRSDHLAPNAVEQGPRVD